MNGGRGGYGLVPLNGRIPNGSIPSCDFFFCNLEEIKKSLFPYHCQKFTANQSSWRWWSHFRTQLQAKAFFPHKITKSEQLYKRQHDRYLSGLPASLQRTRTVELAGKWVNKANHKLYSELAGTFMSSKALKWQPGMIFLFQTNNTLFAIYIYVTVFFFSR